MKILLALLVILTNSYANPKLIGSCESPKADLIAEEGQIELFKPGYWLRDSMRKDKVIDLFFNIALHNSYRIRTPYRDCLTWTLNLLGSVNHVLDTCSEDTWILRSIISRIGRKTKRFKYVLNDCQMTSSQTE